MIGADGRIQNISASLLAMLGYERNEVIGRQYAFVIYQKMTSALLLEIRQNLIDNGKWTGEMKIKAKSGDWIWTDCTICLMDDADPGVSRWLVWVVDISRKKELEQQVFMAGCYDELTSLPNRSYFQYRLSIEVNKAKHNPERKLLLVLIDLDHFKVINDSLGHHYGDEVMKTVAQRIRSSSDESVLVARMSGNQFALLFKSMIKQEFMPKVRIVLDGIVEPVRIHHHELSVTASAGAAYYPDDSHDSGSLFKNAELALFQAKEHGRNRILSYDKEMNAAAMRRLLLPSYLRRALERKEFVLYYQPKLRLSDSAVYGMEALIRWDSPNLGRVSPQEFIPLAEELGLIGKIGEWVLQTACGQNKRWQTEGYEPLCVSVNVSGKQFQQKDLDRTISAVLHETGLDPQWLELELTESSVMLYPRESAEALNKLKEIGVSVSVDDFGTGFSSLNYLSIFPLNTLKIDKSFINDLSGNEKNATLVQAIIDLGHKLGLNIVAEGVETPEQLEMLLSFGCDAVQGYYLGHPIAGDEFKKKYLR